MQSRGGGTILGGRNGRAGSRGLAGPELLREIVALTKILVTAGLLALLCCGCSSETKATADVCSHCAGNQMATSKGTCEACGMAVDVCASCAGEQTIKADGTCSGCGAKIAVKS